jgi:hypothetical protein
MPGPRGPMPKKHSRALTKRVAASSELFPAPGFTTEPQARLANTVGSSVFGYWQILTNFREF